jgi:hypothetical protein
MPELTERPGGARAAEQSAPAPQPGLTRAGLLLTYLACATIPWNGVQIGGIRPGDLFLLLALLAFVAGGVNGVWPKVPGWVWQLGIAVVLITGLHQVLPPDSAYLSQRATLALAPNGFDQVVYGAPPTQSNLTLGIKFLVPVLGLPLLFGLAHRADRRSLRRALYAFTVGSAISAAVAFLDLEGITHLSEKITGLVAGGGRAPGLTVHPNYVAMTSIISVPFILLELLAPRPRRRATAVLLLVPLLLGLYASASRSGAAVGAGEVLLCFALLPPYRKVLPTVWLLTASTLALTFIIKPGLGDSLLQAMRLTGDPSAAGSDRSRSIVGHQGMLDFLHSPLVGIGMQVANEAHNIYLQALSSGGIVLLAAFVIFLGAALVKSRRLMGHDLLAATLFVTILAVALFNAFQNALVDRISYVPIGLIAAMPLTGRTGDERPSLDDTPAEARQAVPA